MCVCVCVCVCVSTQSALGGIQHRKTEQIGYSTRRFVVTLEVDGRGKRETGFRKDGTNVVC